MTPFGSSYSYVTIHMVVYYTDTCAYAGRNRIRHGNNSPGKAANDTSLRGAHTFDARLSLLIQVSMPIIDFALDLLGGCAVYAYLITHFANKDALDHIERHV